MAEQLGGEKFDDMSSRFETVHKCISSQVK